MATGQKPKHSDVQIKTVGSSPSPLLKKVFKDFVPPLERYKCEYIRKSAILEEGTGGQVSGVVKMESSAGDSQMEHILAVS